MTELSHTDNKGKANMVDVGQKPTVSRFAHAQGTILLNRETIQLISENELKKGDVLTVAEIAGIQAAKRTSDLIPLCHPLQITKVDVKCTINPNGITVDTKCSCNGQTGIEMEALTGTSVALLTIYDMCKAVDKKMIIENIALINKTKKEIE
ncbi:MAG: cyclic pyranopterin monophosphate synthase MoaC [Bacteroidota bacterium]